MKTQWLQTINKLRGSWLKPLILLGLDIPITFNILQLALPACQQVARSSAAPSIAPSRAPSLSPVMLSDASPEQPRSLAGVEGGFRHAKYYLYLFILVLLLKNGLTVSIFYMII